MRRISAALKELFMGQLQENRKQLFDFFVKPLDFSRGFYYNKAKLSDTKPEDIEHGTG